MSESEPSPELPRQEVILRMIGDQRVAFLIVGAANTAVAFVVFVACSQTIGRFVDHRLGTLSGTLATVGIAFPINVLFAFTMHRRFVFRVRGHALRDLMRYWSIYLTNLVISAVTLPLLMAGFGLHRIPAQAILLALGALFSFFGHRHFSFRRSGNEMNDHIPPA